MKINLEKVAWKDMGEEVVVVDLETNLQIVFNETSRVVWLALAEGAEDLESVLDSMRSQFSGLPNDEVLARDISGFLDDMISKGLIYSGATVTEP